MSLLRWANRGNSLPIRMNRQVCLTTGTGINCGGRIMVTLGNCRSWSFMTISKSLALVRSIGVRVRTDSICDHLFMPEFPERLSLADVRVESSFYTTFMARAGLISGYCVTPIVQSRRYASLPGQWSDFRKQISRNTHKQIKRRQNRLDALGNASLQICSNAEELEVAFKALVDLHSARWQSKGGSGSFDSESYQAFHFSLMQQLLQLGQLFLITLKIDEQIIAVEYAFLHKGTLLFFQTGFDPAYEHLSNPELRVLIYLRGITNTSRVTQTGELNQPRLGFIEKD